MNHGPRTTRIRPWWVPSIAVVLLGVLPLAGLALLVEKRATAAVRAEARDNLSGTSELTARFLDEQLRGLQDIAASYARRQTLLRALQRPAGPDIRELTRHLTELRDSRPDVLNVTAIADLSGTMIAWTEGTPPSADFSGRDWFRGVLRTGATYVSEAFVGASPGNPLVIAIGTPVRDSRGTLIAIIAAGYTLESLQQFVAGFAKQQGTQVTVTDRQGVVIARPGSGPTTLISRRGDQRVQAALRGRTGVTEDVRAEDGARVLSAYAPAPALGWTVLSEQPTEQAYSAVHRLRTQVVLLTAGLSLLFVLGGVLLAHALRARDAARTRAAWLASMNSAVLDSTEDAVVLVGVDGRALVRNTRMDEISQALGLRDDASLFDELRRVAPAMSDPAAFASAVTALESDPELELTDEATVTATGRSFRRFSRPIRDQAGQFLGRLSVLRETTADREAESALLRARDEAELANAAKTEFLTRMSHELRTPLHAILGFGELLSREDLPADQRDKLEQMTSGGRHLLSLINEVLDLSRVERGELSVSIEPVLVSEVVQETLALTWPLADARAVTLTTPTAEDLHVFVLADRQRLKQILLNLISNAVKYTQRGGEVAVSCGETADEALRITVSDNGPGIAAEQMARVFGEFQRLGAEATAVEGTGLGLSLSKRLVEAMRGRIGVASEPGRGSTFWFELPLTSPPFLRREAADTERTDPRERVRVSASSVLLVEDNPAGVKLVETILTQRPSIALHVATDGATALELARSQQPALILLDLNLPDLSGAAVLAELRSDPRTLDIPVVMLSADATPREVKRLLAAGADDYLTKPFTIESLLAVVDGERATAASGIAPERLLDAANVAALQKLATSPRVSANAVQDLVTSFVEDASARLAVLRTAVDGHDAETTTSAAHALRGGAAGLGAVMVSALAQRIEMAANEGDFDLANTALTELAEALQSTRWALVRAFNLDAAAVTPLH